MNRYLNIPSATPLTKQSAYKEAVARFGADRAAVRQDRDGITWQGQHGGRMYAEWAELPAAKR